jgi:hypothetical protein
LKTSEYHSMASSRFGTVIATWFTLKLKYLVRKTNNRSSKGKTHLCFDIFEVLVKCLQADWPCQAYTNVPTVISEKSRSGNAWLKYYR